jgi:hypothetical protein
MTDAAALQSFFEVSFSGQIKTIGKFAAKVVCLILMPTQPQFVANSQDKVAYI